MEMPDELGVLFKAVLEYVAHVAFLIVVLAGFELVHAYYDWRHPNAGPIVFNVTMGQIFKLFDLALIVGILGIGTWKVLNAYRK